MLDISFYDFKFLLAFVTLGGGLVMAAWIRLEALKALEAPKATADATGDRSYGGQPQSV